MQITCIKPTKLTARFAFKKPKQPTNNHKPLALNRLNEEIGENNKQLNINDAQQSRQLHTYRSGSVFEQLFTRAHRDILRDDLGVEVCVSGL